MFKRFTERARRVIILAREEAELYRHEYLGTEHILQGVVKDGGGIAVAIIQKTGVDLTEMKKELEKNLPRSSNSLIIGDLEGYVHWLDKKTGETQQRISVGSSKITSTPLILDRTIYVLTDGGDLISILTLSNSS